LTVKQGSVSGTVTLSAKAAAKKAAYNWQYSTDQKTWTSLPQTLKAKTGVSGLTAGTTYYFRSQALTPKGGDGDWGQVISLLVK
jgi:beta-xylosidase